MEKKLIDTFIDYPLQTSLWVVDFAVLLVHRPPFLASLLLMGLLMYMTAFLAVRLNQRHNLLTESDNALAPIAKMYACCLAQVSKSFTANSSEKAGGKEQMKSEAPVSGGVVSHAQPQPVVAQAVSAPAVEAAFNPVAAPTRVAEAFARSREEAAEAAPTPEVRPLTRVAEAIARSRDEAVEAASTPVVGRTRVAEALARIRGESVHSTYGQTESQQTGNEAAPHQETADAGAPGAHATPHAPNGDE